MVYKETGSSLLKLWVWVYVTILTLLIWLGIVLMEIKGFWFIIYARLDPWKITTMVWINSSFSALLIVNMVICAFWLKNKVNFDAGSLSSDKRRLNWHHRMKIAAGAAKGLEYLHDMANPPVIYRDLKWSLDEKYNPKLSDFVLAKLGPIGDNTHVSTRVMGTYGYCAPEYARTGQLTIKSDIYIFGVVLLEFITGREAVDSFRRPGEENLVSWVSIFFVSFPNHFIVLICICHLYSVSF